MKIQDKYKYESFRALRWGVGERQGVMVGSMFRGGNSRGAKVPSPINPWLYPDYTYTLLYLATPGYNCTLLYLTMTHLSTPDYTYTLLHLYLTIPDFTYTLLYLATPDYTCTLLYLTIPHLSTPDYTSPVGTVGTECALVAQAQWVH